MPRPKKWKYTPRDAKLIREYLAKFRGMCEARIQGLQNIIPEFRDEHWQGQIDYWKHYKAACVQMIQLAIEGQTHDKPDVFTLEQ